MDNNEINNTTELGHNSVAPSDTETTSLNPVINNKIDTESSKDSQDKLSDITSPTESENSLKSKKIPLTIRCPFTTTDLNIYIDPSSTVLHLKRKICKEFPSNPKPSDQRLIFGGRIIQNTEILSDVLKRQMCDLSTPPTVHLIINSLAIQHAKSVKPTASSNNSENQSSNNTPSSSIQTSPNLSKSNINETENTSSLSSTNNDKTNKETEIDNTDNTATEPKTTVSSPTSETASSSKVPEVTTNPYTTTSVSPSITTQPDVLQYVLINNVIYAVQVAPTLSIPMSNNDSLKFISQPNVTSSNDTGNTSSRETNAENNNNNNNNNNNDNNDAQAANIENARQEAINQILNENEQRQQQPNQFFLLIRLSFIVYLLTQGGGYIRMFIVTFVAIIIFLVQTGRIRVTVINYRNLPGVGNNPNQNNPANNENNNNDNNNNNNNDNNRDVANNNENEPLLNNENNNNENNNNENNNNNNNNNNNVENVVPQYSFLANCRRVFLAFFLSLIPFIQDVA